MGFYFLFTASDSATNSTDGNENTSMSSESNVYSVFGGEFVASKHGKPLGRERWLPFETFIHCNNTGFLRKKCFETGASKIVFF